MENTTTTTTPKDNRFAPRAINTQDTKFDDEASQQSQKAQPYQSSSRAQTGSAAPTTGSARGAGTSPVKGNKAEGRSEAKATQAGDETDEPTARGRGMKAASAKEASSQEEGTDEASDLPAESESEGRSVGGADWTSEITAQGKSFEKTFNQFVTKRPLAIMAGAIAVGFLANRYLAGRASGAVGKMDKGV